MRERKRERQTERRCVCRQYKSTCIVLLLGNGECIHTTVQDSQTGMKCLQIFGSFEVDGSNAHLNGITIYKPVGTTSRTNKLRSSIKEETDR